MLEARSAKPKATERSKKPNESEESYAGARCMSPFLHCITPFLFLLPITFVIITTDHGFEIQRRPRDLGEDRDEFGGGKRELSKRKELIIVARAKGKIATDTYAIEEAKRAAAGLLPARDEKKVKEHEPRHEAATDEQVYDRFKKRLVPSYMMWRGLMSRMRR